MSFSNIKLSENGLLYVYYREAPTTRFLSKDILQSHDINYQVGLTTLKAIKSIFNFTISDYRNFMNDPKTKIYNFRGNDELKDINITVKYAKRYQIVMLATEEQPVEHAFLTDYFEIEERSKISPEIDGLMEQTQTVEILNSSILRVCPEIMFLFVMLLKILH